MNKSNNNQGAINALKGYRVQFLYSLLRILSRSNEEAKFFPEGEFEDLDIYNSAGKVLEIIQVKNLSKTLTLFDVLSGKKNSFIRRAISAYQEGQTPGIKLVTFGEVNSDIQELNKEIFSADFKSKLKKQSLKDDEISLLEDSFTYEIVEEENVKKIVLERIKDLAIFTDSNIALDLLIYWIYTTAEQQTGIEQTELKEKLTCIGKYQIERESFHRLFGTLIRPLDREIDAENLEALKSDFYRGISATYKHIVAGVDVIRREKLESIKEGFSKSSIVFIHGASGQGKSTLAYRYLHDYCSDSSVYELKLSADYVRTYEVINSLEGIAKGLGFPLTLYIDVDPGNSEWVRLLEELSTKKQFNFLITVRKEDWNSITVGDKFQSSEVELAFQEDEAKLVYDGLNEYQQDLRFVDFEDAWMSFGNKGPLLEFVYFITQKESLPAKLKSQIDKMRDDDSSQSKEKLKLLRHVVLADCFSARIKYRDIARQLELNDIGRIVELLEMEYLVKSVESGSYITGLHPIRSEIIKELLFDEEIYPESEHILNSLSLISEDTILNYLRNGFKQSNLDPKKLLDTLETFTPNSWQSYHQLHKALLWKGIDDYLRDNRSVLDQIHSDYGKAWILVVDFNFVNITGKGGLIKNSDLFTQQQRQYAKEMNQQLGGKESVLKYCKEWIGSIQRIDAAPQSSVEWDSFGLFLFWLDYLGANDVEISFNNDRLNEVFEKQPLYVLSHVLYALKVYNTSSKLIAEVVEPIFLQRLSEELNVILVEKHPELVRCHYLFDIINEKSEEGESDIVHAKTLKIINLLRLAFPGKKTYGTKGYGHLFSFVPDTYDSSVKEIPESNLPLEPLVGINSSYSNLYSYSHRPPTWQDFADLTIRRRQLLVEVLKKLNLAFQNYYQGKNSQSLLEYYEEYAQNCENAVRNGSMPLLPQVLIDEWGDYAEGSVKIMQSDGQNNKEVKLVLAVKKYDKFLSLRSEYNSSLEEFIRLSAEAIVKRIMDERGQDSSNIRDNSRISLVGNLFKAYECLLNFQRAFRNYFEKFADLDSLRTLDKDELDQISALCFTYHQFIHSYPFESKNHFKTAIKRLDETKGSIQKKVTLALKRLSKERGITLRADFLDEHRCCVVKLEVSNSIESLEMLEKIYNALYQAIGHPDPTSIKRLIIDSYYPVFHVLPLVRGKVIAGKWYEFKSYNLIAKEFSELAQFNLMPYDIPGEITSKYNIQSWNKCVAEFNSLDKMLKSVSLLPQLAFHLVQLKQLDDLVAEDCEEEVLKDHVARMGKVFQKSLSEGLTLFTRYAKQFFDGEIEPGSIESNVFLELIESSHKNLYPNDELYAQGSYATTMTMEQMEDWLPRLEELKNHIALIYFALADDAIAKSSNLTV